LAERCVCHAVRAAGSNVTLAPNVRAGSCASKSGDVLSQIGLVLSASSSGLPALNLSNGALVASNSDRFAESESVVCGHALGCSNVRGEQQC
jgi:hypothetical protein